MLMTSRWLGRTGPLAVALTLMLVLAGCGVGGDDDDGGDDPAASSTSSTAPAAATTLPATSTTVPTQEYTVQTGDTLSGIANQFGVSIGDLSAFNEISDPNRIAVGQVLRIPPATATSTSAPATASSDSTTST